MSDESAPASKRIIVLIDDEPSVLFSLKLLLGAFGFQVVDFNDPTKAISYFEGAEPVDLVMSDLRMPKVDGLGVLAEAKRMRPQLPFILMSGHATAEDVDKAQSLGSSAFLAKPFSVTEFKSVVAKLEQNGCLSMERGAFAPLL